MPSDDTKDNNKELDTQMEPVEIGNCITATNPITGTENILNNLKDETTTNNKEEQIKNDEEMDLDFEEISDGELEEEARVKGKFIFFSSSFSFLILFLKKKFI